MSYVEPVMWRGVWPLLRPTSGEQPRRLCLTIRKSLFHPSLHTVTDLKHGDPHSLISICVWVCTCVCCWVTLDVIVECTVPVAVLAQQTESIDICKVLKLYETVPPIPVNRSAALSLTEQKVMTKLTVFLRWIQDLCTHIYNKPRGREQPLLSKTYLSPQGGALLLHGPAQGEKWGEEMLASGYSGFYMKMLLGNTIFC